MSPPVSLPRRRPRLLAIYSTLLDAFGPQHWWPAETPFEVMVGAVLTQNVAWKNVERAIRNLKREGRLDPWAILDAPEDALAEWLRPCGYFRLKAKRLRAVVSWYVERCDGRIDRLRDAPLNEIRHELLGVPGVGPETADSILCYAAQQPTFVIDAYTLRIGERLGCLPKGATYEEARAYVMARIPREVRLYNEFHALFVALGNRHCRRARPLCGTCPLRKERHRSPRPMPARR